MPGPEDPRAVDAKQRPLAAGDRVTIPAVVQTTNSTDGELRLVLLLPRAASPMLLQVPSPGCVLRCMPGDNNGLDDTVLEDAAARADAHFAAELASRQAAHTARLDLMDAALAQAEKAHAEKMAALQPKEG